MQKTGKMQTDNCSQLPKYVIIVAGGQGLRMGGEIPKQFRPISGHPVLMHTLEAFYRYDPEIEIILVLPEEHQNYWNDLCLQYRFTLKHRVITGGPTRFHSVKNGLDTLPDNGLVAVHDGVRPLVSEEVIDNAFEEAKRSGAVIPVIEVTDSLRELTSDGKNKSVPRSLYRSVQTPQVFKTALLKEAYSQPFCDYFTDDASVVEATGKEVKLIKGNTENIKITTPKDLLLAEMLLSHV